MNVSIIVASFRNTNDNLLVPLSRWICYELHDRRYTDDKLLKSFTNEELDIAEFILKQSLNSIKDHRRILGTLLEHRDIYVDDEEVSYDLLKLLLRKAYCDIDNYD